MMPLASTKLERRQLCKLIQFVRADDREGIRRLIEGGVPNLINLTDPTLGAGGETALGLAAAENKEDLVSFLLGLDAHPDVVDGRRRTPIMRAAEFGHVQSVERLINNKPAPDLKLVDVDGKGALFYCIAPTRRHELCAKLIVENEADVNNCSRQGLPALLAACETANQNEQLCLMMLEKGADPNSKDQKTNRSALLAASTSGSALIADAILKRGGDVDCLTLRTRTHASHGAAMNGHLDVLRVLSAHQANFDQTDDTGNTPIHYAAAGGHGLCVRFLAQRGCNPKPKNKEGLTARILARNAGAKDAVKECRRAERFFGKSAKNAERWALTLYDYVCFHQNEFAESFQKLDADQSGRISRDDFTETVQNLCITTLPEDTDLQRVASLNEKDKLVDYKEFLAGRKYINKQYLLSAYEGKKKKGGKGGRGGGRAGKKTKLVMPICTQNEGPRTVDGGPSAVYLPQKVHVTDLTRFNRDRRPQHAIKDDSTWYLAPSEQPRVHVRDLIRHRDFNTLRAELDLAPADSDEPVDSLPYESGGDVDMTDRFFKTPLMVACLRGDFDLVKILVGSGADVNARDNFKWTPLHFACHSGMKDIVDYLLVSGANLEAKAMNGATPLIRAIESSRLDVVQLLIERGAKLRVENRKGETPMDVAIAYANYPVYSIVKAKWDSLPPIKDSKNKGSKSAKSAQKPKSTAQSAASRKPATVPDSLPRETTPQLSRRPKSSMLRSMSALGGATDGGQSENIAFYPTVSWSNVPTTEQLITDRVLRRGRYGWQVDFADFKLPFLQNVAEKVEKMGGIEVN